jgi:hypothetical protein
MLQNIWCKETLENTKERVTTQRHGDLSLLKIVLEDFSLVVHVNYC